MSRLKSLISYLSYYTRSTNQHGVHSPFVFHLVTEVIYNRTPYYSYAELAAVRNAMLDDKRMITVTDLGAGSKVSSSGTRKVSEIARSAGKPEKYGQLLFRLVNYFQPSALLELGTSLGISTLYQGCAMRNAKMITIEGCPETAKIAKENMDKLQLSNIELMTGDFDQMLPAALDKLGKVDYAFFDGNHRKSPTLKYFKDVLAHAHSNSIFIFDDIHWSPEMEEAWEAIKDHPQVTVTIDLFFMGLVFFRKEQRKEHFVIRF